MDPSRFASFRIVRLARVFGGGGGFTSRRSGRNESSRRDRDQTGKGAPAARHALSGRQAFAHSGRVEDGRAVAARAIVPANGVLVRAPRAGAFPDDPFMNVFECDGCGQLVHFGSTACTHCAAKLAFDPGRLALFALAPDDTGGWRIPDVRSSVKMCANEVHGVCNWVLPAEDPVTLCVACRLNRTIPDLSVPGNAALWARLEAGKHRLVYSLLRFGLPLAPKTEDPDNGLAFDFLSDAAIDFRESPGVMTGHNEGLITINIREADDVEREKARQSMAEPYRTVIGHFRHEIGHYYWSRLVAGRPPLNRFRALFGDEREDYGAALERHYARADRSGWPDHYVSSYASAHPWEDFAETWAHYTHIVDTLDTAYAYGLRVRPRAGAGPGIASDIRFPPYEERNFQRLISAWLPLTYAVNSLNESMGQPQLYPFVLAEPVLDKLRFVHRLVRRGDRA